jgi:alkylation response protein AidB-like acyl-CoA dehydrogenase
MDLDFNSTQAEIIKLADSVLSGKAGPERARKVLAGDGYDEQLESALVDAGLLGLYSDEDAGPLEATLVVERVAYHHGLIGGGASALVAPALGLQLSGPVVMANGASPQTVRFAGVNPTVLVLDENEACVARVTDLHRAGPMSPYGYRSAEFSIESRLGAGTGQTLLRWWRVALAAEVAGAASAALDLTLGHLKSREQFGRPLAALQAIQHRLAEVLVAVESTRWLTRFAAYTADDAGAAASAAASAVTTARLAIWELHQMHGALGFTKEYDLHLLTMHLHALRLELDGVAGTHATAVADLRWGLSKSTSPRRRPTTPTLSAKG